MRNGYALSVVAILAAGCVSSREVIIPAHHADRPQTYRDAYVDGCRSVQSNESQSKDMQRIRTDSAYANGWYDGVVECKASQRPLKSETIKK